ncbi:MAG: hypothetical protein IT373_04840 [Polyangiaceae bacterium]|nr:hypothetical protein [Polyangiaceae bacterium]
MAALSTEAQAQEVQITGPLAGAPAYRRLRLHRDSRFELAPTASFTLLDEYRRHIMPSLRATYHFTDWFGLGLFGGPSFSYNAGLSDELQEKAIDGRSCADNPYSPACRLTAVNLCRGEDCLADKQLGRVQWMLVPQLTFVPFRGKVSLFSALFMDTDINLFLGPAIVGVQERQECGGDGQILCSDAASFELASRVTAAPSFGIGLNFYPADMVGFGTEFRVTPLSYNTSGFDVASEEDNFPDNKVDSNDRKWHMTSMVSIYVSVQLPPEIEISD